MTGNVSMWLEMARNGVKLERAQNGLELAENRWKLVKITGNGFSGFLKKMLEMTEKCLEWLDIAKKTGNGYTLLKIVENG